MLSTESAGTNGVTKVMRNSLSPMASSPLTCRGAPGAEILGAFDSAEITVIVIVQSSD